jgi:imidazole glycerol-phosphate synthase subunit HisH
MQPVIIIDYGIGNIYSIKSALKYLGVDSILSSDSKLIRNARQLILPGVGSFRVGMSNLKQLGLNTLIHEMAIERKVPVLGICLGMQLMGLSSSENDFTKGLGLVKYPVTRFTVNEKKLKIPHVGFNTVQIQPGSILFKGFGKTADFYFTHSYYMKALDKINVSGLCFHGEYFIAGFEDNNIFGTQFHPEKSQSNGLLVLKNFLEFKNDA